jgi:hypothetical protein
VTTTYAKGDQVTTTANKRVTYTVVYGPFETVTGGFYVLKGPDCNHHWASGRNITPVKPKPEGYREGDRVKIQRQGDALATLSSGPYIQPEGTLSWVVKTSAGRHVMVREASMEVVERPVERTQEAVDKMVNAIGRYGTVVHKGFVYPLGPNVVYRDRHGMRWGAELIGNQGLARMKVDGPPRQGSATLVSVINAYGPLTLQR